MKNKKLFLPIGQEDIRLFQELVDSNEDFSWTFKTECGEPIDIKFTQDNEEEKGMNQVDEALEMIEIKDIGNKCIYCFKDTSFGSGRFVNRIPATTDELDGYSCYPCQSEGEEE